MTVTMRFLFLLMGVSLIEASPIEFPLNLRPSGNGREFDRQQEVARIGELFRGKLTQLSKSTQRPRPSNRGDTTLYTYPNCAPSSSYEGDYTPNGADKFSFYFPSVPSSMLSPLPTQGILCLRTKDPAANQKTSTPSSKESTPNDVDANLDAPNNIVVVHISSSSDCSYCNLTQTIDLSNSYPYAKIDLRNIPLRWSTADYSLEPQWLDVRVTDAKSGKPLNMNDYFVGRDCTRHPLELNLQENFNEINPASLERFSDSFLYMRYWFPHQGISIPLPDFVSRLSRRNGN